MINHVSWFCPVRKVRECPLNRIFVFLFLIVFAAPATSQSKTWDLTLVTGKTHTDVVLEKVSLDSLSILKAGSTIIIPLKDLAQLRHDNSSVQRSGTTVLTWMTAGAATGALVAYLTHTPPRPKPGYQIIGTLDFGPRFAASMGGVLGGLVGLITGIVVKNSPVPAEVYLLSHGSDIDKYGQIRYLIHYQKEVKETL